MLLMLSVLLIVLTLVVAFANGANDVSKGIATLVGSGVSNYRRAMAWGSLCTVAGALTAALASQGLVATFSGKGILTQDTIPTNLLLATAFGAIGWLIIATRTGMPVSTTHSLTGALIGAAIMQAGMHGVIWRALATRIALPLVASPVLALIILLLVLPPLRPLIARFDRYCVCVEQTAAITPEGIAFRDAMPVVEVGSTQSCSNAVARFSAIDSLHWISSGAASFFRGLNDTPKILALGITAGMTLGVGRLPQYALVALAMGIGSVVAGARVTRTLAEKVTRIAPANGLVANLITSLLVGAASRFALPVSTTHVSSGAIVGIGLSQRALHWKIVREMLLAWLVTLPASAVLAAGVAQTLLSVG
jgi:PiT family inorganic phosphate transporter